jgi:hypothetical protein
VAARSIFEGPYLMNAHPPAHAVSCMQKPKRRACTYRKRHGLVSARSGDMHPQSRLSRTYPSCEQVPFGTNYAIIHWLTQRLRRQRLSIPDYARATSALHGSRPSAAEQRPCSPPPAWPSAASCASRRTRARRWCWDRRA